MAIKVYCHVNSVSYNGNNLVADVTLYPVPSSGFQPLRTSFSQDSTTITDPTTLGTALKTAIINFVQSTFSVTLLVTEILVYPLMG